MVYILRAGIVAGWEWATSDVGGRERRQQAAHKTPAGTINLGLMATGAGKAAVASGLGGTCRRSDREQWSTHRTAPIHKRHKRHERNRDTVTSRSRP